MNKQSLIIAGIVVVILLGGAWLMASQNPSSNQSNGTPQVVLANTSHDWGNIGINDGNASTTYTITNSGDGPLELSDGRTSCGCTTAELSVPGSRTRTFGMHSGNRFQVSVAPGESADLKVVFDPLFHGPQGTGPITRQVTLETNDPMQAEIVLSASANVVAETPKQVSSGPAVDIAPATHDFGTVIYGDIPTTTFTLANNSSEQLSITRITTSCSCTTAEAQSTTIAPNSSTNIEVAFNPAIHEDDTDLGELTRTVFIETDNPEFPKVTADITANVVKE